MEPADAADWLAMRVGLWAEDPDSGHRAEFDLYFAGESPRWPWAALPAADDAGRALGLAVVALVRCSRKDL